MQWYCGQFSACSMRVQLKTASGPCDCGLTFASALASVFSCAKKPPPNSAAHSSMALSISALGSADTPTAWRRVITRTCVADSRRAVSTVVPKLATVTRLPARRAPSCR